jgi:hypothetical protein
MSLEQVRLDSIDQIITELGDPEFWSHDAMDTAINGIAEIIDPENPHSWVFYHKGGSITDDGMNPVNPGWCFWDEAGLYVGPFDTRVDALVAQQEYVEALG